jgi:exodeoxyribonuclease VII small subunit
MDTNHISFDDGLKSLETAVQKLENGTLTLEEALRCFEEGTSLAQELHGKLEDVQRRVDTLRQAKGGEYVAEPLEGAKG